MNLTKEEATMLIVMLKRKVEKNALEFPNSKGKISFDVLGEQRNNEFVVSIERKGINSKGCSYQGRNETPRRKQRGIVSGITLFFSPQAAGNLPLEIKSNNIILLRLDINPTAVHINQNGEKITGSHLHIYEDEHTEMKNVIPFDISNKDLFDLCQSFFEKFNVVEPPVIKYQPKIFNNGA